MIIKQNIKAFKHFSKVEKEHISHPKGFAMRYIAEPDGAWLTDCVPVHAHKDKRKAKT